MCSEVGLGVQEFGVGSRYDGWRSGSGPVVRRDPDSTSLFTLAPRESKELISAEIGNENGGEKTMRESKY